MHKKILITGANGFIGQHLTRKLIDDGYTIRGTRFSEQPLYFIKENEIAWVDLDLQNPATLHGIANDIDCIYHLAAIPRNDLSRTWDDFYKVNIEGTRQLLLEAKSAGVRRFVFISTVEAAGYGDGTNPRQESDTAHPDNNYGKSKLAAEQIVLDGSWPFECVVIRLPMIYGPGTFMIVPKLFGMVQRGFYPLIGSGNALMEFCYVENAVEGILLCGTHSNAPNNLFYVSDERSYSIKEVISTISKIMNKKIIFLHIPSFFAYMVAFTWELLAKVFPFPPIVSKYSKKPFFTRETVWWTTRNVNFISAAKIKSVLGYSPKHSIAEGCSQTFKWLKQIKAL